MDWDDAYANSAYIPDAESIAAAWPRDAAVFRASAYGQYDIRYGARPRERYDLFLPNGPAKGLFVFIHGGYWMSFDKSSWSHMAAGAVARGWAAALPSYDLCPQVRIGAITVQIGAAVSHAAGRVKGPIVVSGHSAGGHLAVRMACRYSPISHSIRSRICHALGISGLYDLRPLMRTAMNATLRLMAPEAILESPALLAPVPDARVTAWVGADERPEFRRQSALLVQAWSKLGARMRHVEAPGCHHFNVIAPLSDPQSALTRTALGELSASPDGAPHPG